jgi:hypothetical protein
VRPLRVYSIHCSFCDDQLALHFLVSLSTLLKLGAICKALLPSSSSFSLFVSGFVQGRVSNDVTEVLRPPECLPEPMIGSKAPARLEGKTPFI